MKIQLGTFPAPDREKYLPYSSGVLESYVKKDILLSHVKFESPLWDYGQEPEDDLAILGLTCYIWSQDYCDQLAKAYKEKYPNTIIIFGGPNVPVDPKKWKAYENERPFVDTFVAGAGEEVFKKILHTFPNLDKWYRLEKDKKYKYDTPTVYVDGTFDKLLESNAQFTATIETTRGCPFKCSFCDWGDATGSVVSRYDNDINYASINKVLNHPNVSGMRIIDANWGMYERDLDMTKHMAATKRNDFYITFCGIAKNSIKYVPEIAKIFYHENFMGDISVSQPLKIGVQTWHPTTLKYTERDNIKESSFKYLLDYYKENNIPYNSELIVGLPGETSETWLYTLQKDFEFGVDFQNIYNLEIVANMPMLLDHEEDYQLKIKTVYIPKMLIEKVSSKFYHKNKDFVIDDYDPTDDLQKYIRRDFLVSSFSFDEEELLKMYDYTWWMNTLYNTRLLDRTKIISVKDEIIEFFATLDSKPFWKEQVERHRACWREAMIDGKIRSAHATRYWTKTLNRADELMNINLNFEQAEAELGKKLTPFARSLELYNYGWKI